MHVAGKIFCTSELIAMAIEIMVIRKGLLLSYNLQMICSVYALLGGRLVLKCEFLKHSTKSACQHNVNIAICLFFNEHHYLKKNEYPTINAVDDDDSVILVN